MPRVYYFGCWNTAGHYLHHPGGGSAYGDNRYVERYGPQRVHIDGSLAPRVMREPFGGGITYAGAGADSEARNRIESRSNECPQGQFLLHHLDSGFTAIQWWDRNQGDTRSACNSTLLLDGTHDSATMLAALAEHFPHVLANLKRAGVELVEVSCA